MVGKKNKFLIYWSHGKHEGNSNYETSANSLNEKDLQTIRENVAEEVASVNSVQSRAEHVIIKNIMKL